MSEQNLNPKEKYNNNADVRAEVIAADYISEGMLLHHVTIKPAGTFRRTYSKDVLQSKLETTENDELETLEIEVSREGLYDMLPEGLFHQPDPNKRSMRVTDIVDGMKKTRKEEEEARKFFLPIEKEMYRQRILVELEERKAYDDYSDHYRNELFFQVWPDLLPLKKEYISPLIQILPRAFTICGDIPLTEYCFEKVLGTAVNISTNAVTTINISDMHTTRLGNVELGVDAFAGDLLINFLPTIVIEIGPVKKYQLQDYLNDGAATKALAVLCNYLLPAEADVHIELKLATQDEQLFLNTEKHEAILGFTSRI